MAEKKEAMSKTMLRIGKYSFVVGITLAVLAGIFIGYTGFYVNKFIVSVLILLGLIIGLINITPKETSKYIIAVISLFLVMALGGNFLESVDIFGPYFDGILKMMMVLFLPSMILVALKAIWDYAADA